MGHTPNYRIQFASTNVLYNRRMEYDELKLKGGRVTAAMVASA